MRRNRRLQPFIDLAKLKRAAALALFIIAIVPFKLFAGEPVSIGPAHSGAWYDPSHNGEGYLLEILDAETAVVYWFTYDENGEQRWFSGTGKIVGNTITFDKLFRPTGPVFGDDYDADDLVLNPVGSAIFRFNSCNSGIAEFVIDGTPGELDLARISGIAGHDCGGVSRRSSVLLSGLSGSWYLPVRNGEGFVVEIIAPDTVVIYWFTYNAEGGQAWYFGTSKIVDSKVSIQDLYATRGPSFGPDYDPADLELTTWGQLELDLNCDQLDYSYTSKISGDGARTVEPFTEIAQTQCVSATQVRNQLDQMLSEQPDPANFEFGTSYATSSKILGLDWSGVAGQRESQGPPLTAKHAFKTSVLGEIYTAALVLRLVEKGELDLDASIADYLPADQISGLSVFEGQEYTSDITLRHLLNHRSGLPDLFVKQLPGQQTVLDVLLADLDRARTGAEMLELANTLMHAESVPDTEVRVTDLNYIILGEIIESVTGQTLDASFRQWVADPLGMTETWSMLREQPPAGITLAAGQLGDTDITGIPALRAFDTGNDWASTTADLGVFMRALFGEELFEKPSTLDEMITPQGSFIGVFDFGLGTSIRTGDCALPDGTLLGFMSTGGFALYIPEREAFVYGFNSRLDYFAIGYVNDVLLAMFGSERCSDSGGWDEAETSGQKGFSDAGLAELEEFLATTDTVAMMAIADEQVVFKYGLVGRRYASHSIRKTFVSALYGAEVDAGLIDLDDTMNDVGIDDHVNPLTATEKTATVRHLLQSRSGIYLPAAATSGPDEFRPPRGSAAPGTAFFYNNWDFNTAGTIYENATGTSVYDRFLSDIAVPIGMEDIRREDQFYIFERLASEHPAYMFTITARDMARFGQLFLSEGRWKGERVITTTWVRKSTKSYSDTNSPSRPGFGYMNWSILDDGSYMATGSGGHKILVMPEENMVVVLRVDTYNDGERVGDTTFFQAVDLLKAARE